jgi:hypothetical protein
MAKMEKRELFVSVHPGLFDLDYGNGIYDVANRQDFERWDNQMRMESDRERRKNATEEELKDPLFDVPY